MITGWSQTTNDNFADGIVLSGLSGSVTGDNLTATAESNEPNHAGNPVATSVWFHWTADRDGLITFDTVGSEFNTVLAVYTGDSVISLVPVALNDDIDGTDVASQVKFYAVAGTTYHIAIDGRQLETGNWMLNWFSHGAGLFFFSQSNVRCTEREGARLTVSRVGGFSGRVRVSYEITNLWYTNIFITNIFGTNTLTVNSTDGSYTNTFVTYTFSTNIFGTNTHGLDCKEINLNGFVVTNEDVNGTITEGTNFFGENLFDRAWDNATNTSPSPDDPAITQTIETFCTNIYVTNIVASAVPFNPEDPEAPYDYTPTSEPGILVFDDFEMMETFSVPVRSDSLPRPNRLIVVNLLSAELDSGESADITIPDAFGTANIIVEDLNIDPDICNTNAIIFNFAARSYRVREDVIGGVAFVAVSRTGTDISQACSIDYRIDHLSDQFPKDNNVFRTQPGSDYALPDVDFTWSTGTLSWGANDRNDKFIAIPINNDTLTEFNEDLLLELEPREITPEGAVIGNAESATLTIIDDDSRPSGSVDPEHNKDNDGGTNPPHNEEPGANLEVYAVAVQPDNKTIIGGEFTSFNGAAINYIARMNPNGQMDTSFNVGSGAEGVVWALAIQSDSKIIVGGDFGSFNNQQYVKIVRLNANGSVDSTFKEIDINGAVRAVGLDGSGKILVGGDFTSINGTNRNYIARLNSDGSLDTSFDPGEGPSAPVFSLDVQANGNVVIGGMFAHVNGVSRSGVARLDVLGALDAGFDPGAGADDTVFAVKLQPDGKVLVGGSFRNFDLRFRKSLARLNANGNLDTTFDTGTGADDTIYAIALQSDGRIYIGGLFTIFNGTRRIAIARLDQNGYVDTGFMDTSYNQFAGLSNPMANEEINARGKIAAIAVQGDGKVMIGGKFSRVGGGTSRVDAHPRLNIARLMGGSTPGPGTIEFVSDTYSGDENLNTFITLTRRDGNLGEAGVVVTALPQPAGPGAAELEVDYSFAAQTPIWFSRWFNSWMVSDGYSGQNNNTSPTSDDVYINLKSDGLIEGNETLQLQLSILDQDLFGLGNAPIPVGTALGRSKANFSISDRNTSPGVLGFSSTNFFVNENATNAVVNVRRVGGSSGSATVRYAMSNGTAVNGSDYTATSGTLSFTSGSGPSSTNATITIPINNDIIAEAGAAGTRGETFTVRLFQPNGAPLDPAFTNTTVTILDNDFTNGLVNFDSENYKVDEKSGLAELTVLRTGGGVGSLSVSFATANGTAINGSDYLATNGVLSWTNGDTAPKKFWVPLVDDNLIEGDETVLARIFNPLVNGSSVGNQVIGSVSNATVTIANDDFYGLVQFNSSTYRANENGGEALITVVRTGGSAQTLTVNFVATNGTAFSQDFRATNGTLTFSEGEVSKTFSVSIRNDPTNTAPTRTVNLFLVNANPVGQIGSPSAAVLTIYDDESYNEPPGSLDTSYDPGAGADNFIYSTALQSDGRLLIGGDFTKVNGLTRNRIARLNSDGKLDKTFSSTAQGANGSIRSVVSQTDGRVLIAGAFTVVNNTNRNYIARLNFDGSIDGTFNPGSGADNPVYVIVESFINQTNRFVLIGGQFSTINGSTRHGIARLTDKGAVDSTFNPGLGVNGIVYAIAVQSDGKILIGGDFTTVNGTSRNRIARLNTDGSLDQTFDPGVVNNTVRAIVVQPDGRILMGGLFTVAGGVGRNHFARLNANGSIDSNFNIGVGVNDSVYTIALQIDGRIILGGEFTQASGVTRNRITRLKSDGTVDPMINFGLGANSFVASLAMQTDGKIILGGGFTEYNGVPRPYLARIYGGTIAGNGKLEFASASYRATENSTNAVITLRRNGGTEGDPTTATGDIAVNFATGNLTAQAGSDYVTLVTNVSFPPGEVLRTVEVPLLDDPLIEADEDVHLSLSFPPDSLAEVGNQPTATLTIVSEDSALSFAASTFRGQENALNNVIPIVIVRLGDTSRTCAVECVTVTNGTAVVVADYISMANVVTFEPGETSKTNTVTVVDDALIEGDETFQVQLRNATDTFLVAPTLATVTIVDNDFGPGAIGFAAPAFTVSESGLTAAVTLFRTNGSSGSVSVNFSTANGTAFSGVDYLATNGVVVFADGETNKTILVRVNDDSIVQGNRTFSVTIFNPTGSATILGPTTVPVTILDNEVGFRFATPAFIVTEGNSLNVTVFRENGTNGVVSVDYRTAPNFITNAIPGTDYLSVSGTLVFTSGETVKSFAVSAVEDSLVEGDESFQVILSNPTGGAQILPPTNAAVTIVDNDSAFEFGSEAYTVSESSSNVVITVIRTNANTGTVSVRFATTPAEGNSATVNSDYIGTNGILTFAEGESIKTFTVPILNDSQVEGDEVFGVTLSNPSTGAQLNSISNSIITIVDDDAGIAFSSGNYALFENSVSLTVDVIRLNNTNSEVSVDYAATDGTALVGQDYQLSSGRLTFAPGETIKTFTITLIDDTVEEGNETLLLKLSNPSSNASLVNPSAASLTIVDNDGSTIAPAGSQLLAESIAVNGIIDTNETVTVLFALRNAGLANTVNLVATLLSTNGVTSPSGPQSYGALVTNGPSSSRPFSFTANGANGAKITAVLQVQDVIAPGVTNDMGRVSFSYVLGTTVNFFTNGATITLNDNTSATPYASTINVAGVNGTVTKVTATLTNVNHTYPDDVDILMVGPGGQKVMLMSDAGSRDSVSNAPNPLNFVTLWFDDAASAPLPDAGQIVTGTYRPTDYENSDNLANPAPVRPYGTNLSVFNGANPNGTWSLFAQDDEPFQSGSIMGGWGILITSAAPLAPTCDLTLTVNSLKTNVLGDDLTYTITVTNHGPSAASSVMVTNTLPAGASFVSATGSYTISGNKVVFNLGGLAKDAKATVTLVVHPNASGIITNSTTATAVEVDPNSANNIVESLTTVLPPAANLAVSVSGTPNPAVVRGGALTYTIVITNYGPATATNVCLTNTLPSGMGSLVASPNFSSVVGNVVIWTNLGSVSTGAPLTVTISGVPALQGTFTNTARVGSPVFDPLKGNNTAAVKTIVDYPQFTSSISAGQLRISWPSAATGYVLQSTTNLSATTTWVDVPNPSLLISGDQRTFSTNISNQPKLFFRLKKN